MRIQTSRFGNVDIQPDDILFFRRGILGFEECQHWVILADAGNRSVAWLQSMQSPEVALPVVSPRRFVADYQVRIDPVDIESLHLGSLNQAYILAVVSRDTDVLTLNLRAPIIINLDRRLGCQVITSDQQPIQYELTALPLPLRRTA
jgi:flagellar assembly factor FliW